jgi:hypothetical protein
LPSHVFAISHNERVADIFAGNDTNEMLTALRHIAASARALEIENGGEKS